MKLLNGTDRTKNEFRDVDPTGALGNLGAKGSQISNMGRDNYQQYGQRINTLADQLARLASGEDSLSALQLKQGTDRNVKQQMAMGQSGRGAGSPLAARLAAQNAAQLNAGLSGAQAQAGIQERSAAQNALGGLLGQARGQDLQAMIQGLNSGIDARSLIEQMRGYRFKDMLSQPTGIERGISAVGGLLKSIF